MSEDREQTPYEKRDANVKRNQKAMDNHRKNAHDQMVDTVTKTAEDMFDDEL